MAAYSFLETGAGAQSLCNTWNKLASTIGLMRVAVTAGRLEVVPSNSLVLFLVRLLRLDLVHNVRVDLISSVLYEGEYSKYKKILISYTGPRGRQHLIRVFIKDHNTFFHALGKTPPV